MVRHDAHAEVDLRARAKPISIGGIFISYEEERLDLLSLSFFMAYAQL